MMECFELGVPVWPVGQRGTWNQVVGFYVSFEIDDAEAAKNIILKVTAADCYRVWVNGVFFAYGPARTAHGYSRVDALPLVGVLVEGVNHLAIEVSSCGIDSYAYALHDPFLQAEILQSGQPLIATGGDGFRATLLKERIQKVELYSKQRPFAEAYRLPADCNDWRTGSGDRKPVACETVEPCRLLPRHVPLPEYRCVYPIHIGEQGEVVHAPGVETLLRHAARDKVGIRVMGYPVEELEIDMSKELLDFGFVPFQGHDDEKNAPVPYDLDIPARGYGHFDFGSVQGGFIETRLHCNMPTRVYLQFDETQDRKADEQFQLGVGAIALDLEPGEHAFTSFEPYSFSFIRVIACEAPVTVHELCVREYAHPVPEPAEQFEDAELNAIFRAGWQTFRTNSVDLFTDCMSRERGGYPCDSYFTARAELALTGENRVERNFLENYFLVDSFASIPQGMVPHCYPSDRLGKGQFIPNWGLWLVLQLCEYCLRTGDERLRDLAYSRIDSLFGWFAPYRNEQGLLEDLPGWVFVEWSPANEHTDAVNHPTNMLYSRCLAIAADLYDRADWRESGAQTREAVRRESWNGAWFADQSKRVNGLLQRTEFYSETCQYHAFFFGITSREESVGLWQRLRDDWGPMRSARQAGTAVDEAGSCPGDNGEIRQAAVAVTVPAALLYGLMLRFLLLQEAGERERLLVELRHVFGPMAQASGTLWEHIEPRASLNHGFASVVCFLLQGSP